MDFQQFYRTDVLLKQLKEKIEHESYPPRFRITVNVNIGSFFSQQHNLKFAVIGAKEDLQKNIAITAAFNGMSYSEL